MRHDPTFREQRLLAAILERDPSFGTVGYLERAAAVVAVIHTPNAPGPGPAQRPPGS